MTHTRRTKYSLAVTEYMQVIGHATNAELWHYLRRTYPELSATTVHRVTAGMVKRNELALAPVAASNAVRFDVNLDGHDHFECMECGCLRDTYLPHSILDQLSDIFPDCKFSGHLNIQGVCGDCLKNEEER